MHGSVTNFDAQTLALLALAWCLGDARRADRLLSLTGLTTDDLRARAGEPALGAAVLGFLEAHEPDLVACAEELDVKPERLIAARAELDR
jgi:hypothetical protein